MKTAAETIAQSGFEPHVRVSAPFEIVRAEAGADRIIEGTASVDGFMEDGVLLEPEGFPEALRDYMDFALVQSGHRLLPEFSVGRALDVGFTDGVGMSFRAMISRAPDVESLWVKVQEKILRAVSLGFFILDGEWDAGIDAFRATKFVIPEVSIVPRPADGGSVFQVARGFKVPRNELRALLEEKEAREAFLFSKNQQAPEEKLREIRVGRPDDALGDIIAASAAASTARHLQTRSLLLAIASRVKP